jgi:hypothetical protein
MFMVFTNYMPMTACGELCNVSLDVTKIGKTKEGGNLVSMGEVNRVVISRGEFSKSNV